MKRIMIALGFGLLLVACAPQEKDYDAMARCQAMGHKPGTQAYDTCLREERQQRMMREQRDEYERSKQEEMDWKLRRY